MEKPLPLEAAPGWKAELGTLLVNFEGIFFLGYFSLFERIMLMISFFFFLFVHKIFPS